MESHTVKLRQTMLLNLYLMPNLLGEQPEEIEMWHGCNQSEIQYLEYIPPEFLNMRDRPAGLLERLLPVLGVGDKRKNLVEVGHRNVDLIGILRKNVQHRSSPRQERDDFGKTS